MNRRIFLKSTTATALLATTHGWSAEQAAQGPSDDEVTAQTKDRIDRFEISS
jgi:hypothetical protein